MSVLSGRESRDEEVVRVSTNHLQRQVRFFEEIKKVIYDGRRVRSRRAGGAGGRRSAELTARESDTRPGLRRLVGLKEQDRRGDMNADGLAGCAAREVSLARGGVMNALREDPAEDDVQNAFG